MALQELRVTGFRCLGELRIEAHPGLNVISGANGAGKTSLLEAVYVLGRGRSFRAPRLGSVVRAGVDEAVVFARLGSAGRAGHRLGLRLTRTGVEAQLDGRAGVPVVEMAAELPVQLIDPTIHDLVQGGPEERRRFLDWGVFHVEQGFIAAWRRYRRALQQRNAALRQGAAEAALAPWEPDLAASGEAIDGYRRAWLARFGPVLAANAEAMLGMDVDFQYRAGWGDDLDLATALAAGRARDRAQASTQVGPHRAELRLIAGGEPARHRLSRGQQKMLASALVLSQTRLVMDAIDRDVVLLVDEPAAELDPGHQARFFEGLVATGAQVFVTTLEPDALPLPGPRHRFHVEHGTARTLV